MSSTAGSGLLQPILQMVESVFTLPGNDRRSLALDLTLQAGDFLLVQPGDERHERVMVDGICGLAEPDSGSVRFLGRDWRDASPDQANAMRGRIGHVFRWGEWVPHLSVADNLMLSQLHHTQRTTSDVRDEAADICRRFGLPGLPTGFADELGDLDRRRASYARAFMGDPKLVIIESPLRGMINDSVEPVLSAIRRVRDAGSAVIWLVLDSRLWSEESLPATGRLRLHESRLVFEGADE